MDFTLYLRRVYDDVALLLSVAPDACDWKLEVDDGLLERTLVPAKIVDSHLNWSTSDLTLWTQLRNADSVLIQHLFPDSSKDAPASTPFAVAWDISRWHWNVNSTTGKPFRLR